MEKLEETIKVLRELAEKRFNGSMEIHFSQGGIGIVKKVENILSK